MQVIPQPDPQAPPIFSKLYICLDACKRGFKARCRPLIGLDGCFLKGYYGGQLLSAISEDANKSFYVITYAVVDSETKENWKWFLTLLQEDIGNHGVYGWNFISDQQKGLIPALQEVMPGAHHRFCVQHFQKTMQHLKGLNEAAWKYLDNIDPSSWVKAYFSHWPKCDNITNMAQIWNAKIVGYRSKPIFSLLEELRCYIMRRMTTHQRVLRTIRGKIAPAQQKKLDQIKLTGLPCEHAVAAICHKNEPPENYVHQWLTVDALHATYAHTLNPVNSDKYWPSSDEPKPLPPKLKRPIGCPKKHRRKDPSEEQGSNTKKVKRTYATKCPKCGQHGHYAKTCKGPPTTNKGKRLARPENAMNVRIGSSSVDEIPLSQGGPAAVGNSQPHEGNLRGSSPPPSNPQQAQELLSNETINVASSATRSRLLAFMSTPGFRPPRPASRK
ncbi:uncharacterized protein LOC133303653 [Gastrolobium bilobum]|uniref:uncharacterized protein LOC133303653 n=1 Tax=Gastrolobium bilobum TaxID=150636 RepID=UPI002AB28DDB|nr:uncharacterized protein LOC133303653 [Gastrolobium bilobum]